MNMALHKINLLVQITIRRFGLYQFILVGLFILYGILYLLVLPAANRNLTQKHSVLLKLNETFLLNQKNSSTAKNVSIADTKLDVFYDSLAEKRHVEQQVRSILALAAKSDIVLKTGEYKLSENKEGGFFTYRIQLPVKGEYGQIRKFIEQVLLLMPFASLDEIGFKRDTINNPIIESKITFTIFLLDTARHTKGSIE